MAMTGVRALFVDTNVLIYATDPASPLHRTALDTLQRSRQLGTDLMISPQILREYLSAATRRSVMGGSSSIDDVLKNFRAFRTQFTLLEDSHAVLNHLDNLVQSIAVAGKQVHDANIVATMLTYRVSHLLTHNVHDFNRFVAYISVVPLVSTL